MADRTGIVTFKGNPITLEGTGEIKVGQPAPDFTATAQDMSQKKLSDFRGKTVVLSVVPSLDTPVCDKQTRRFNEEAAKLSDAVVLTLSMDLPMAAKRWCGAAGISNITTLSDYRDHSAGKALGLRIKELGLLARAVYVIDKTGKVVYGELVKEVTQEPNYDAALAAAKSA